MANPECPFCQKLGALDQLPPGELIAELPYAVVLLGPWQYYQGYCIVVARQHATELSQLDPPHRQGYFDDMCRTAQAIEDCFHPHKLNYELLGNQVPHLHWHLFPRYPEDPALLKPVWLALERAERDEAERKRLLNTDGTRSHVSSTLRSRLTLSKT